MQIIVFPVLAKGCGAQERIINLISGPLFEIWPRALPKITALAHVVVESTCNIPEGAKRFFQDAAALAAVRKLRVQYVARALADLCQSDDAPFAASRHSGPAESIKQAFGIPQAIALDERLDDAQSWARAWCELVTAMDEVVVSSDENEDRLGTGVA